MIELDYKTWKALYVPQNLPEFQHIIPEGLSEIQEGLGKLWSEFADGRVVFGDKRDEAGFKRHWLTDYAAPLRLEIVVRKTGVWHIFRVRDGLFWTGLTGTQQKAHSVTQDLADYFNEAMSYRLTGEEDEQEVNPQ